MRFDLVVNIFSLYSTLKNEIQVFGGGAHSRPFLHIGDCGIEIELTDMAQDQPLCPGLLA